MSAEPCFAFDPPARPSLPVSGSAKRFPVRRIYCVGRNYAAHAKEMGGGEREAPFFFTKPADALVQNGATIPYPTRTADLHHEIELVLALGRGGSDLAAPEAGELIWGHATGIDLTRRDLQAELKQNGRPWDTAKGFDRSAPVTAIQPAAVPLRRGRIWLTVNGELRQEGDLSDMIWGPAEIVAELSTLFRLEAGDLIFTGTPAGVGPLQPGDEVRGGVEGLDELTVRIGPKEV